MNDVTAIGNTGTNAFDNVSLDRVREYRDINFTAAEPVMDRFKIANNYTTKVNTLVSNPQFLPGINEITSEYYSLIAQNRIADPLLLDVILFRIPARMKTFWLPTELQ